MTKYTIQKEVVHISDIKPGDTVLILGEYRTISKEHIKNDFLGGRIQGQPCSKLKEYPLRHFERLLFPRFFSGSFVGYFSQV